MRLLQGEEDDVDNLWEGEELEDGELEELLADAQTGGSDEYGLLHSSGEVEKRRRGRAKTRTIASTQTSGVYMPLTEPMFVS